MTLTSVGFHLGNTGGLTSCKKWITIRAKEYPGRPPSDWQSTLHNYNENSTMLYQYSLTHTMSHLHHFSPLSLRYDKMRSLMFLWRWKPKRCVDSFWNLTKTSNKTIERVPSILFWVILPSSLKKTKYTSSRSITGQVARKSSRPKLYRPKPESCRPRRTVFHLATMCILIKMTEKQVIL